MRRRAADVVARIPAHVHQLARELVDQGRARSIFEALELMAEAWRYVVEPGVLPGGRPDTSRLDSVRAAHAMRERARMMEK